MLSVHTFPVEELYAVMNSDTVQASQVISQHIQIATPGGIFPKSLTSVGNMSQKPSFLRPETTWFIPISLGRWNETARGKERTRRNIKTRKGTNEIYVWKSGA